MLKGKLQSKLFYCNHLGVSDNDEHDTVSELEEKGIPCEPIRCDAYTDKPMTFFRDPDGLPIEIHE